MCHLYPYNNVKLLRKFFYINNSSNYIFILYHFRDNDAYMTSSDFQESFSLVTTVIIHHV